MPTVSLSPSIFVKALWLTFFFVRPWELAFALDTQDQEQLRVKALHQRRIVFKPTKLKPIVLTGEVIDVWCYISETMGPGRGQKHKACAAACGHGGVPLGILEDKTGNVYIAAKSPKPYQGCKEMLLPYVAQRVRIKGFVACKGGCQILRVQVVEPLAPQ